MSWSNREKLGKWLPDGVFVGRLNPQPADVVIGELRITPTSIVYRGEVVEDAGAVHRALLEVLNGRPLPLARQAVASVVSQAGGEYRVGWLRPERVKVGTLLYCPSEVES